MLSTDGFKEFAKDVVLFAHVTTRIEGDKYANLLSEKGGRGFPFVVAMDAEGNVLAGLADRTVDGFKVMVKSAVEYQALRAKKDLTAGEQLRLLRMDLDRDRVKPAEFREKALALKGLDAAGVKDRDAHVLHADIQERLQEYGALAMKAGKPIPDKKNEVGAGFAAMYREGRRPTEKNDIGPFYDMILGYAEEQKDVELYAAALDIMKKTFGDQKRMEPWFKQLQEKLDKMKADGGKDAPKDGK